MMRCTLTRSSLAVELTAAWLLTGCSNNNDSPPTMSPSTEPTRGTLIVNPPTKVASYTTGDLISLLGVDSLGKYLVELAYTPACSIDVYQLQYNTIGGKGESTTASGALMVPTGGTSNCVGTRPIVLYAHGTNVNKAFNIAQLTTQQNSEGLILAAVFAGQGYIVVAPNYAGYDTSALPYHPYLVASQQSADMIDALTAAKSALPVASATNVTSNGKVFVTGYSQGGFVAMATESAMQAAGSPPTATGPMSGPYTLSAFGDAIFMGQVPTSAPLNITFLIDSYQQTYGNVYSQVTDVFAAAYASGIEGLLPTTGGASTLYSEGKLPENQLFNSVAPSATYAPLTPATTPTNLAPIFALGFGPAYLIINPYRNTYLTDATTNPDGGFPTLNNDMPPASPAIGIRQNLKKNDLRNFTPQTPMLLCGGNSDPTVFFLNTQLMMSYWGRVAPSAPVSALDIDSSGSPAYSNLQTGFAAAKAAVAASSVAGGATDGGAMAVLQAYHATLVPPFCLSAVKRFFDTM